MLERETFDIVESTRGREKDFTDLRIDKKEAPSFTGSEIVYARTSLGEKVVIKIPSDKDRTIHEWQGLSAVEKAGVSIPPPIALVNYPPDRLAIVSNFIEGDNLYFNPNPGIKAEVGRQIKKMHQKAEIDGRFWESSGRSSYIYYDRYIFSWGSGEIEELQIDSRTSSLLKKFSDMMMDFCKQTKPVFNHNDLHDGQIILSREGAPVIIDFGDWKEESWLNDIAYHLFHLIRTDRAEPENFANFLNGYLGNDQLSEAEKSTLAFYLLFISARALNYFSRRQSSYLSIAKETHRKIVDYLEKETIWKKY